MSSTNQTLHACLLITGILKEQLLQVKCKIGQGYESLVSIRSRIGYIVRLLNTDHMNVIAHKINIRQVKQFQWRKWRYNKEETSSGMQKRRSGHYDYIFCDVTLSHTVCSLSGNRHVLVVAFYFWQHLTTIWQ